MKVERRVLMKTIKNINRIKELIGKTIYFVRTCKDMPKILDGDYFTATGEYCVYLENCPWSAEAKEMCEKCHACKMEMWNSDNDRCCDCDDIESCEKNEQRYNIFEDYIDGVIIKEDYEIITLENCGSVDISEININTK